MGFIDSSGREVIAPRFSSAGFGEFVDGLASVFEAGKGFGYIDESGKFVIGPTMEWGWGRHFHEGIASVMIVGKNGERNRPAFIDRTGKIIFEGGSDGYYFSDGLMPMPADEKWGYVDKQFRFVIPPQFEFAENFSEGRAVVKINDSWGFIDTNGKVVGVAKYDLAWRFQDGVGRVRIDIPNGTRKTFEGDETLYIYRYGFVDRDGNEVIPLQFDEATYFSEGFALASDPNSKMLGVIDKHGTFVHTPKFDDGGEFHEGLAVACAKRRCGFINTSGGWVIKPIFESADEFRGSLARVTWSVGVYGYIDRTGKAVWKSTDKSSTTKKPH